MAGSSAELIKEKLDIAEVIRERIQLLPAGKNFKALCPFHKEKTPSFMVSPDRQSFKCFGCGKFGDVISFVMQYENIEFGEALKVLAEKAGIELRQTNPAEYKFHGLLYDLNDQAKEFFKQQLARAPEAKKYLEERGLTKETIDEFELGWAPNEPDALVKFLLSKNVALDDAVRAGLLFKSERGGIYDRFRGRIMFPIANHLGKTVGFTGRVLPQFDDGKMGKYVNSPETAIFNKSKILYGFNKTKNFIREAGKAFLVEGQMDLIMSFQAGVKYAAASSGTAFTADHMRLLSRVTEELLVSFDNDAAGLDAGERVVELAEANDFRVRVVRIPDVKDPAEAAAKDPAILVSAIERAVPAMEFFFEKYLGKGIVDVRKTDGLRAIRAVLSKIKAMASAVEQDYWIKALAKRTGIRDEALRSEADHLATPKQSGRTGEKGAAGVADTSGVELAGSRPVTRHALLAERLIGHAWAVGDFSALDEAKDHIPVEYGRVIELLRAGTTKSENPGLDELLNLVMLRAEPLEPHELAKTKTELKREHTKERRRELTLAVRRAEEDGDNAALEAALKDMGALPSL